MLPWKEGTRVPVLHGDHLAPNHPPPLSNPPRRSAVTQITGWVSLSISRSLSRFELKQMQGSAREAVVGGSLLPGRQFYCGPRFVGVKRSQGWAMAMSALLVDGLETTGRCTYTLKNNICVTSRSTSCGQHRRAAGSRRLSRSISLQGMFRTGCHPSLIPFAKDEVFRERC